MSGIGSFLNQFAATTFEGQKRKQEFMQFQMQLAVQQAALQQQQMNMQTQNQQFQQQMQFKEQQRKDDLAQQKTQNQLGTFRAQTEAANVQSEMENRKGQLAEKERSAKAETERKYDVARNDKVATDLQKKIANQKAYGVDTSKLESELEQRYQELGGRPPAQTAGAPAQAGPLTGQETAQAAPGQAPAQPMATEAPQATASPQGQPVAQGQPQAQQISQQPQQAAPAPQQQSGPVQPASENPGGMEEFPVKTPQEEERWNKFFKDNDIPKVAISDETKQKNDRQKKKDRFDAAVADAATAGMPENVGAITDIFRQHGLDVDVEAHQKGTKIRSRRAGGHIGGSVFGPMGLSFGGTEGKSEQTVPTIDLFPKTKATARSGAYGAINQAITGEAGNEDKSLDTTIAMGNALADAASKGIPVSQPYVGAVKDVARDRIADTLGTYAKKPVIEAKPFDTVNEPARHRAAGSAIALTQLDQKLAAISEKNGVDYATLGVPQVVDASTAPKEVLGSLDQALTKISTQYPNMNPHRAEGQVLSELTTRLQNQQLDPAARADAEAMLKRIQKSIGVSDQFKKGAVRVLGEALAAPAPEGGGQPTAGKPAPGKPTSALEEGSRQQAGKLVASAENVTAANKALGTVAPSTPDKNEAAKNAVNTVKTNYKAMTEAEQKKAQETWKAKRSTPAWKAVSEPLRKNMNEAVGLARNDGFTA